MASKKDKKEEARRLREEREAEERKKQRRKRRIWQVGAAVVVAVAVIVIAVLISSSGGNDKRVTPDEQHATKDRFGGIAQSGITLGNPQAKVTLYEFADLQCPFCRQYTKGPFHELVQRYVKPGKVKMVFRGLTFIGGDSVTAARAASAAGAQNRLWQFVDLVYRNQGAENTGWVTDAYLRRIAAAAGLDVRRALADRASPAARRLLEEAKAAAGRQDVQSTPSFVVARRGVGPVLVEGQGRLAGAIGDALSPGQ